MINELVINTEEFEGPIHLLLEMFKSNKLEITLMNIDVILDQYVDYIDKCKKQDILMAANYLDLAAEIIVYKSRKILRISAEEDEEEEEEILDKQDLIDKILEYKSYKEASKEMEVLKSKRELFLTKEDESLNIYLEERLKGIKYKKFLNIVNNVFLDLYKESKDQKVIVKKDLNINEYIERVEEMTNISFKEFFEFLPKREKVIYFLAILVVLKKGEYQVVETENNVVLMKIV